MTPINNNQMSEQEIHKPIIETMEKMGYGLLTDGETFYLKGMELEPRNGITFTMNQAYAIYNYVTTLISHERVEAYKKGAEDFCNWNINNADGGYVNDLENFKKSEEYIKSTNTQPKEEEHEL